MYQVTFRTIYIQVNAHHTTDFQLFTFISLTTNRIIQDCFTVRKDLNYLVGR